MHLRRETGDPPENRDWRGFPAVRPIVAAKVFHNSCGWRCAYLVNSFAKSCRGRDYPPDDQNDAGTFHFRIMGLDLLYRAAALPVPPAFRPVNDTPMTIVRQPVVQDKRHAALALSNAEATSYSLKRSAHHAG